MPAITTPVVIDATGQPGYAGTPLVQLDGTDAGGYGGLTITGGHSTVKGLAITHFGSSGIVIQSGGDNVIQANYLGVDPSGATAEGNAGDGVTVVDSANNIIEDNVLSGNGGNGLAMYGAGSTGNRVLGNFIGTDAAGSHAVPNAYQGVVIASSNNTLGGHSTSDRNVISGNRGNGVYIPGTGAFGNRILGNFIGTDATGTRAVSNGLPGVHGVFIVDGAHGNVIGTDGDGVLDEAERNVLSGNTTGAGVAIYSTTVETSGNVVAGNYIGTAADGVSPLGNNAGVELVGLATNNRVGTGGHGASPQSERNVIGANPAGGVILTDRASSNMVAGNFIGTDAGGTDPLGNGMGVFVGLQAHDNVVGTDGDGVSDDAEGNVISGNAAWGVLIQGTGTDHNLLAGNRIGTDLAGEEDLGNGGGGVGIDGASDTRIGGSAEGLGNTIAFNGGSGVTIYSGSRNAIRRNLVFGNDRIGIDLGGDGPTRNRPAGASTGPNGLQNHPQVRSELNSGGASSTITGTLTSTANATFTVEIYATSEDSSVLLATQELTTDDSGVGTLTAFTATVPGGSAVAATAADRDGNTSEFSILADVVVRSVRTEDSRTLIVDYDVNVPGLAEPFDIGLFRSDNPEFDAEDTHNLIGIGTVEIEGDDLRWGPHRKSLPLEGGGLPPEPRFPYVLAVADPDGEVTGVTTDSSRAYFHVYTIGAVVQGLSLQSLYSDEPEKWTSDMANSLITIAGYNDAFALPWSSAWPDPRNAAQAGIDLADQISKRVNSLSSLSQLQPNDVIDLHLIGHSRGAVVISEAMQLLLASSSNEYFRHGYMKMTLLDPHPANNAYGDNASVSASALDPLHPISVSPFVNLTTYAWYKAFQLITADASVTIPERVNEVEDFYQESNVTQCKGPLETFINLHGLSLGEVQLNPLKTLAHNYPLTGLLGMGHTEVHEWYQYTIVSLLRDGGDSFDPYLKQVVLTAHSPVALLITDPLGKRFGHDPATGLAVNDFGPLAYDSGAGSEPQILALPVGSLVPGQYQVTGVGTGSGPYHIDFQVLSGATPGQPLVEQLVAAGTAALDQPISPITPVDASQILAALTQSPTSILLMSDHLQDAVYGQLVTFTALVQGALGQPTGAVQFRIDGLDIGLPMPLTGGVARLSAAHLGAGPHTVTAAYVSDAAGFVGSVTAAPLVQVVAPAPLKVTALSDSTVYGAPLPPLRLRYTGFVNGDTADSLSAPATATTTATTGSHAGDYPILVGGAAGANYWITYVGGTLHVAPAPLTITADDRDMVYGGGLPALTASYSGFVNGDTPARLQSPPLLATAPATSHAGAYAITVGGAADPDYAIRYVPGTLTVTPATLTVTAVDARRAYGEPDPDFTVSYAGFTNGDTPAVLLGFPQLYTDAALDSPPDSYTIFAVADPLTAADYTLRVVNGTLTVSRALTTTAVQLSAVTLLFGQDAVVVSASVVRTNPGIGSPDGAVRFFDDTTGTELGSVPLVAGAASLTTTALGVGGHAIRAVYVGDGNFLPSEAAAALEVIAPASLSGTVFVDFNNDGEVDFGENGIPSVAVSLTGTDDLGQAVSRNQLTDANGTYLFLNLRPGDYVITEAQPAGYTQGVNRLGTAGGTSASDQFFIALGAGADGMNYNFGERPPAGGGVSPGLTAGIGFWNNKKGQALIRSLNGGPTATRLGDWLAATFPNMFGANAGASNLAGHTNAQVAEFFQGRFRERGKLDAQVLATALAAYVTTESLAGTTARSYGFQVTQYGLGGTTFNVGPSGAAFGVDNNTTLTVMDLLLATNRSAVGGVLYYDPDQATMIRLRDLANTVYTDLNGAGGIG